MQTKKEFRYFTIFNHQKEEAYLRRRHNEGWKFAKVSGFGMYHFEKCEPQDVVYQLDYNKVGLAHHAEYVKMFEDCGWEYLQEYAEYSYFRKPAAEMNGEEEIFSDPASKEEMMARVFKGRLVPILIIFCLLLIPSFVLQAINGEPFMMVVDGVILLLYIAFFIRFAVAYYRVKNRRK